MVSLDLHSRRQRQIANFHEPKDALHGDKEMAKEYAMRYPAATHRPTPVCYTYNCHGLTFASRRTAIISPEEVRKILEEDDYHRIASLADVMPGDIVVYISEDNDIEHSGIVIATPKFEGQFVINPVVLSKWGSAHEVIHRVMDCPYNESRPEYYRVMK
jgi:hypothetical protein